MRLARTLPDGSIDPANKYSRTANVAGPDPGAPWAMHLGTEGAYHFLVFDFDAHTHPIAQARSDMASFVATLERVGSLPYLVCESSPGRGFHVWLALAEPVPAPTAAVLADLISRIHPTIDKVPLNATGTGCARTPGAPHRYGGASTVLYGDPSTLLSPTVTRAAIARLHRELTALAPPPPAPRYADVDTSSTITLIDSDGHRHLPGSRLPLGPVAQAALTTPLLPEQDASAVLFTVLLGAARARWHFDDLLSHLETAPGLEHARTYPAARGRRPRSLAQSHDLLSRQWDRAVATTATTRPTVASTNSSLGELVVRVTDVVAQAQAHADASPGRWSPAAGGRGDTQQRAVDRAVLDELHRIALHALVVDVGASIRSLSSRVPAGRESVRRALHRLAAEGWIALTSAADGTRSAVWSIDPSGLFHRRADEMRSLGGPTPRGAPHPTRPQLLPFMEARAEASTHDLFSAAALGCLAGRVYALAHLQPGLSPTQLADACGLDVNCVQSALDALSEAGVAYGIDHRWRAREREALDVAATALGVGGTLAERAWRYRIEQTTWAYWQAELVASSWRAGASHSAPRLVTIDGKRVVRLGPYPRRPDRRGHWRRAREWVEAAEIA